MSARSQRILAYTIRHLYLYKRSLPRLMEVFYWPVLDLLVWGFVTVYLSRQGGDLPQFVTFFIGALILWDMLFRSQQGISVSFLEDVWSRNLLNIFVMGFSLIPLVANLIVMGWAVGIVTTALILRFGQEAEVLAWGVALLFQPVSAVFYPVAVLPWFLRVIANYIPAAHVFEGMRVVFTTGAFPTKEIVWAAGLNVVYIALSVLFFYWNFKVVKEKGLLAKGGE